MSSLLAMLLLVLLAYPVTSQINFSPTWGTGKRSNNPESSISFATLGRDRCWAQANLKIVYELTQVIKREAERLNECLQTDNSVLAWRDQLRQLRSNS